MKRYFIIFLMLIGMSQTGGSQTINDLFAEFSNIEQANHVRIGKCMMKLAGIFTETLGVNHIDVLEFDDCESEVKERLNRAVRKLKDPAYETLLTSNEKGSHTKIMLHIEKEMIRELVVLTTGDSHVLVRIKGKIKPADLDKVINGHGKGC